MRFCSIPDCKFPVFSTDKITRKGYCRSHATKYRTDIDRRSIIQKAIAKQHGIDNKVRTLVDSDSNKEILIGKGKIPDENLELFFKLAAVELAKSPWCENCGAFIGIAKFDDNPDVYRPRLTIEQVYRNATAHILPKAIFHSVRAHPLNKLFLNTTCGCHNKSHRWDTFSKMECWHLAVRNFKEIYPYIDDEEKKNIPDVLWKEIPAEYEKYYGHRFPDGL